MSASLVGSEMCIRDRCTPHAVSACLKPLWASLGAFPGSLRQAQASLGAVSYTHLTLPTICSV
eukprot:9825376-Alexandrium_andersonii.AAC.1